MTSDRGSLGFSLNCLHLHITAALDAAERGQRLDTAAKHPGA